MGEQEALQGVAPGLFQKSALLLGFHAFRGDRHPARLGEVDDRLDDGTASVAHVDTMYEALIYLDPVDIEIAQMTE
jgi:hypothetical protein